MSTKNQAIISAATIAEFLEHYRATHKVRAKSLISTFFGDLASPHGGSAWVETIATVLQPLGINNRLVRTSLFRLCEEQWLRSTRAGRKSYYQLTEKGASQTALAEKLIYYPRVNQWDGTWTIVFLVMDQIDKQARRDLEQELNWIGFGAVEKHVWAHPCVSKEVVAQRVESMGLSNHVICMRCENIRDAEIGLAVDDREMAAQCLPISDVEEQYQQFINTFAFLQTEPSKLVETSSSVELLSLRLLLMDEYRRIILHDPLLPTELLPSNWLGDTAYELCKSAYNLIADHAARYYCDLLAQGGAELTPELETGNPSAYIDRFTN